MKKALWILLPLLIVVGGLYVFIPNTVSIRQETAFVVNTNAFTRKFPEQLQWRAWWPGEMPTDKQQTFNGKNYGVVQKGLTSLRVNITDNIQSIPSELVFIPLNDSTIHLQWNAVAATSTNPWQRVKRFIAAQNTAHDMAKIIEQVRIYYSQPINVYGLNVQKERVKDSALISITTEASNYPTMDAVYAMFDKLQTYATANGAKQSGLPMLNVTKRDSTSFRVQVAIPVDKQLPNAGDIAYKWMLGGGNILVAEVRGGPYTISQGFNRMAEYVEDNRRYAPAINYQLLVTDRRKEPDSTKWITRLYWPVM